MTDVSSNAPKASPNPEDTDKYPSAIYAWYTVLLLLVVYTFSFIDRQIVGLLAGELIREFQLTNTQFGLLGGLSFAIFYTTFGLICARIADTSSRTRLIAIGLALWSLMTALSGFARSYMMLFLCRMGVGVGEATLAPGANSLLADSFPKNKLATALSVYSMGIPVGSALAFIVGGLVIGFADQLPISVFGEELKAWQKSFLIVGLPGLLLTVFVLALKEPTRKDVKKAGEAMPVSEVWAQFMGNFRAYASIIIGVSFVAFIGFGSLLWLPRFFELYHGVSPRDFGATFGVIAMISGSLGLLLGGMLADRWLNRGIFDAHIRALLISPLGFIIPGVIFPFATDLTLVWSLVFLTNMFLNLPTGIAFAGLQIISPNECRGQMVAGYVLMTNIIGYTLGPFVVGQVADLMGGGDGVRMGLLVLGVIGTPMAIFFLLWGRKPFRESVERALKG